MSDVVVAIAVAVPLNNGVITGPGRRNLIWSEGASEFIAMGEVGATQVGCVVTPFVG